MTRKFSIFLAALFCAHAWAADATGAANAAACPPQAAPLTPELFAGARQRARDRGLLWRITKDGRSSWLYGTLHVGRVDWIAPGPLLGQALRNADVVALELDLLDETVQRDMAQAIAGSRRTLTPALQARLDSRLKDACLPSGGAMAGPVEFQVMGLSLAAGQRDGLHATYGSEILLSLMARGAGKPVVSLESVQLQVDMLLARSDAEAEAVVGDALEELDSGRARRVTRRIAQVWEESDLDAMNAYAGWCECLGTAMERVLMKRMLDDRNPGLAQGIDGLHSEGKRVLASVGALHMIGPQGLPALLAAKGYVVERMR